MFKAPIVIRKLECGHWTICLFIQDGPFVMSRQLAHPSTFEDVLLLLNLSPEELENADAYI